MRKSIRPLRKSMLIYILSQHINPVASEGAAESIVQHNGTKLTTFRIKTLHIITTRQYVLVHAW